MSIFEDKDGVMLFGASNGLCNYDGKSFETIPEDKDGNIWFGGRYGLLWRFDGEKLEDFTQLKRR